MAKKQHPTRVQSIVEHLDGGFAGARLEIDEDIPTEDDVGLSEDARPVLVEKAHLSKVTHLADALRDVPSGVTLLEICAAHLACGHTKATLGVHAAARRGHAPA